MVHEDGRTGKAKLGEGNPPYGAIKVGKHDNAYLVLVPEKVASPSRFSMGTLVGEAALCRAEKIGSIPYNPLAWLLQKEPVTAPLIGATKISHLEEAVAALAVKLTAEEIAELEEPYVPHRIVGHP